MTPSLWPLAETHAPDTLMRSGPGLAGYLAAAQRGDLRALTGPITPEYADALYAWMVAASEDSRWADVRLALDHIATFEADSSRVLRAWLAWATATGELQAAATNAARLIDRSPEDAEVWFLWGQALSRTGAVNEAYDVTSRARRMALADVDRWSHVIAWCDSAVA